MKLIFGFALLLGSFQTVSAFELGKLALSGTGCFGGTRVVAIEGEAARYALPIRVRLNKKEDSAFDRRTCNMRLPVSLNANEKLQIWNLSQPRPLRQLHERSAKGSRSATFHWH